MKEREALEETFFSRCSLNWKRSFQLKAGPGAGPGPGAGTGTGFVGVDVSDELTCSSGGTGFLSYLGLFSSFLFSAELLLVLVWMFFVEEASMTTYCFVMLVGGLTATGEEVVTSVLFRGSFMSLFDLKIF